VLNDRILAQHRRPAADLLQRVAPGLSLQQATTADPPATTA
jgi:hypothetical protein